MLCALACVLYIFGHARVEGYEVVKLVGGLGAVLLFAAAGWAGDWASERFVLSKIATFAGLFALFGVSFNLALYPTRSVWTSDILQGLALSGLSMACWRKITDGRAWSYAVLGVAPLIVHFLLTPFLPEVPGSQFFYVESPLSPSLFPLNPWLVFAVLGAWVRNESQPITLGAAAIFGAATAIACLSDPGLTWPVKIPMNLSYAFLGCSVVTLAVALIRASMQWELVSRALGWLGGNWLVFFYLQFALVAILSRSPVRSAEGTWTILAIGTLAATWLSVAIASPSTAFFRRPAPWLILLGMILGVALAGSFAECDHRRRGNHRLGFRHAGGIAREGGSGSRHVDACRTATLRHQTRIANLETHPDLHLPGKHPARSRGEPRAVRGGGLLAGIARTSQAADER